MGLQWCSWRVTKPLCVCAFLVLTMFLRSGYADENDEHTAGVVAGTPGAEEAVGERLFLETRFAQAFERFLDRGGNVNDPLPAGDPVLDDTQTTTRPLPGPFAGLTMNCRAWFCWPPGPPGPPWAPREPVSMKDNARPKPARRMWTSAGR